MSSGVKVSKMNFELNPRGNLWFNDESTLGHKLLFKMGWSKGKGLGKNEDGIKENIKISKKDTSTGVGWKNDEIPVAVGCLEYENILQNLQKRFHNNEKNSRKEEFERSLEKRSRSARNHLHYQKFVRGKDLIRYSEKDMKSIFLEKPQKPVSEHPNPTFNSQISINDYFKQKMEKKKEEAQRMETSIITENELPAPPKNENAPKKRKCVSEGSKKLKRKKIDTEVKPLSINDDTVTENISEFKESSKRKKKKLKCFTQRLNSCLKKGRTNFEVTRNVSFNEQVSYKILDTSLELCEDINDLVEEGSKNDHVCEESFKQSDEEIGNTGNEESFTLEEDFKNDDFKRRKVEFTEHTNEEEDCNNEEEEEVAQCLDLPKCSGSNFNFWLENQRQASKMKLYREMMKKIKKNKILRSTNLLDIKGYGNWGL